VTTDISQIDLRPLRFWLPIDDHFAGRQANKKSCVPSFGHKAGLNAIRHACLETAGAVGDGLKVSERSCRMGLQPELGAHPPEAALHFCGRLTMHKIADTWSLP